MAAIEGASVLLRSVTSARASVSCRLVATMLAGAAAGADKTVRKELARATTEKNEVLILTNDTEAIR